MRPGDRIEALDGRPMGDVDDFLGRSLGAPGTLVEISLRRGEVALTAVVRRAD